MIPYFLKPYFPEITFWTNIASPCRLSITNTCLVGLPQLHNLYSSFNFPLGNRRPFGQPESNFQYEKGTVFSIAENEQNEFKALTQEMPEKLPWKIMEKARLFICAVLNTCQSAGTICFGIGDSINKATNFRHGEVVGLEVENLKDDINKAFQSILDDHIKSDQGKLTSAEMKAVNIHYVPVTESNEKTTSYVVEIDIQRDWRSCKDQVYYIIDKWEESDKWSKFRV